MKWLFLIFAIIGEIIGTTALKSTDGFTKIYPSILSIVGYIAAFYFLSLTLTLKYLPVGIAYAFWSAIGIVLVAIISYFLYGQKLDMPAIIGMIFIIIGVVIMNIFSNSISH
ncbi:SMR family transporter [Orbus sturtevantii]|uniref:DMT family transporter n=1 Tax=Orbus sturtevantii TaxID=3074109 RepID=UPI00370D3C6F